MRTVTLLAASLAAAMTAGLSPALAQRCVSESSDGTNWHDTDQCGGGEDVRIILGPPQIVWVRPSAAGSTMDGARDVDRATQDRLAAISQTAYQLIVKGRNALARGDFEAAARYFDAADMQATDSRDRDDIADGRAQARRMRLDYLTGMLQFDQTGGPALPDLKFHKSQPQSISVAIPDKLRDNPTIARLIKEEADAYDGFRSASQALQQVQSARNSGKASQQDFDKALTAYKDSIQKVKDKRSEIVKTVYVLDQ